MTTFLKEIKVIIASILLSISFVVGAGIFSYSFYYSKKVDDTIFVTGSAKTKVVSDSVRWIGSFSRVVSKEKMKEDGYDKMKKDEQILRKFFKDKGLENNDIEISPVAVYENYRNDNVKEYNFSQSFTVKSSDINKIKNLVANLDIVSGQGVIISSGPIEYYYSKLPETRIDLLPEAIKDARTRAEKITEATNKKILSVKSVSMGVVQMMPAGTIDISDYGSYDNTSIEKDVMVTVKMEFNIANIK